MDIINKQWDRVEPSITSSAPPRVQRGRRARDPRKVLNGILWTLRTGVMWKDMPLRYPPYQTCQRGFQQRAQQGVFRRIEQELAQDLHER